MKATPNEVIAKVWLEDRKAILKVMPRGSGYDFEVTGNFPKHVEVKGSSMYLVGTRYNILQARFTRREHDRLLSDPDFAILFVLWKKKECTGCMLVTKKNLYTTQNLFQCTFKV